MANLATRPETINEVCPECADRGCTPDANGDMVPCPVCGDPPAKRPIFRGPGDMARNDPVAYQLHMADLSDDVPADWDDPACSDMWTVACFPDDGPDEAA